MGYLVTNAPRKATSGLSTTEHRQPVAASVRLDDQRATYASISLAFPSISPARAVTSGGKSGHNRGNSSVTASAHGRYRPEVNGTNENGMEHARCSPPAYIN